MPIPPQVHFCWIGSHLPWAYVFAVLSAAERGGMEQVTLHHTDMLEGSEAVQRLGDDPRVQLSRIDPLALLNQVGGMLGLGDRLAALYGGLASKVMQSDVLRAALLYRYGGVYLDLDTVTVASLRPLLAGAPFVGAEFIVWPLAARRSRSPVVWARHLSLDLLRRALRTLPGGWRGFRRVQLLYVRGLNNAVMGAGARAGLLADYLQAMLAVPPARLGEAYALGPDLLSEVAARAARGELSIHEPAVFYPLPPEISEHWFRIGGAARLDAVLSAQTRVVHWYASVRTRARIAQIDPDYVRAHRGCQLYSMLVCSCVPGLGA